MSATLIREVKSFALQHAGRMAELEDAVLEAELAVDHVALAILRRHGFAARYEVECAKRAALLRWCFEELRSRAA